jgi:hypothetical protein
VCVFCSSSDTIDERHLQLAADVGAAIARRGWTLVSGGGSVSMMGRAARAARSCGGRTIGIIPEALLHHEVTDDDADELVVTSDMRTRKAEMDRRSDAFLALAGGIGTLEELIEVWTSRTLGIHDKPVVVLDPDGHYAPLHNLAEHLVRTGFMRDQALDAVRWETSIEGALDAVMAPGVHTRYVASDAELLEFDG